jgi:hypothetical protein
MVNNVSNINLPVHSNSHKIKGQISQNLRLAFYCLYILIIIFIGTKYMNVLTDKTYENKSTIVNFYVKSILTFDIWSKEDHIIGWKWNSSYDLKPVEFNKSTNKFDPLANKNAYMNLSSKYWDKLYNTNSIEEQNAVYQKAIQELRTYYRVSSSPFKKNGKRLAFSLVGIFFSIILFTAIIIINTKAKSTIVEDKNYLKKMAKKLLISRMDIIKKLNLILFDEKYFKKNVIMGLIIIILILSLSLIVKF